MNSDETNWHRWLERWEAMQNCYVPHRPHRFGVMLHFPSIPPDGEARILDLGCGPGSLSFFALQRLPNASVVAVDCDPVLLQIAKKVAGTRTDRIRFILADLREAEWWKEFHGTFDLIVSATTLHWLSAENLRQTFRRSYDVLKPGGWFLNSDHAASDDPRTQARYEEMLEHTRQAAFRAAKADDWNGFWQEVRRQFDQPDLWAMRDQSSWEGTESGQPKSVQLAQLRKCGFEQVEVIWQELGEVIIAARKPPGS